MNGHSDNADANNRKSRTIAIMNVPDTVTAARVEKLVEQFGSLRKCTLRTDHAGAIIEYAEESSVGKAEFGLASYELDGHMIRLGTVTELLQQKPFVRLSKLADQLAEKKKEERKKNEEATAPFGGFVPRHTQAATRGTGRRGGLGFKRGLGFKSAAPSTNDESEKAAGGKNNDYFKNLMAGKTAEVDKKMEDV
jgi:RNA recognition motif-containing protein